MAVLDAQQLRAHLVEAAGLLPQLGGLHHRHQHSTAPAAFISSRTMASTLRITRRPMGM
jgi:hypothetical protein